MRLPRIVSFGTEDRKPEDATSVRKIREMFQQQHQQARPWPIGSIPCLEMDLTHDEGTRVYADFYGLEVLKVFSARAVVLVEGVSDQLALQAMAERRGRNLDAEGVSIVPIGGATNIRKALAVFGPQGFDVKLVGLCDAGEEGDFRRALELAGLGSNLTRVEMERLGFYVCVADLEDELIRALGVSTVELVLDARGDLASFRSFQKQPAWRGRTPQEQLRRFFGTQARRKIQSAALLVGALDLTQVPRPLESVLAHV